MISSGGPFLEFTSHFHLGSSVRAKQNMCAALVLIVRKNIDASVEDVRISVVTVPYSDNTVAMMYCIMAVHMHAEQA